MRAFADSGAIPLALAVALLGAPGPACGGDDDTSRSDLAGADSGDSIQFGEIADSAATDSAAPDAPDSDASCSADPGGFRCPCEDNAECNSGFCIPVREGGKACTQYCTTSCPDGWDCSLIQFPGSDPTFLCIEVGLNLCRPCTSDAQCQAGTIGANGDRCITRGDAAGAFCGIACAEDDDCPGGYECRESIALEGQASVRQCVPIADRECTCSQRAIDEGATTACHDHACAGVRTCADDGLTACNAPTWAAETCNGRDDDCSGATDEGFTDTDHDAQADCVDLDDDDDSVPDTTDDCPLVPDPGQENHDTDTLGDACDDDDDDDSIDDPDDDCPLVPDPGQEDSDGDGVGDACDHEPPPPPTLEATLPASPSQDPTPLVSGHAERGTTITVYADEHCEGEPIGSAATTAAGTFSGPVTVPENQTSTLYGTATDGAGNVSPCSDAPLVYTHDALPPATPFLLMTAPTSPSRTTTTPDVFGTILVDASGIVVRIYRGTACDAGLPVATTEALGPSGSGGGPDAGTFETQVPALANAATSFVADAVDLAGNVSGCSNVLVYVHDDIAPPVPTIADSTPHSPSNASTTPELDGYAETDATVRVYSGSGCSGPALATVSAPGGAFTAPVQAQAEATTTFFATATDQAGNTSACSPGFAYVHNTHVPDPPVITDSVPASPSRTSTTPQLEGTTGVGAGGTVRLYAQPDCGGAVVASASPAGSAFAATVVARANDTTAFSADARDAAGNVSACSEPFLYTHDASAPDAPVLTATDPTSPSATELDPLVLGASEAHTHVTVYGRSNCLGPVLAEVDADGAGAFSAQVTVLANAATDLSATATDLAGNTSACSAPLTYVHDAKAPDRPVLTGTNPTSPSSTITRPTVLGSAEASSDIALYASDDCSGPTLASAAADASGHFAIPAQAAENARTTFTATASDKAGNTSACSAPLGYTHDNVGPATPSIDTSMPLSPSSVSFAPALIGTTDANTTVELFDGAACSGPPLASAAAVGTGFAVTGQLAPNTTRTFYVHAIDAAGNTSGCSSGFSYTHDNKAPAAPVLTGTTPTSPSAQTTTPFLDGTGEGGATITVYTDPDCHGPVAATLADNPGAFAIKVSVQPNRATTFFATATDKAGNTSACSSGRTFVHDSAAPAAPVLVDFAPASPSRTTASPTLRGTVEAGATVTVYASTTCSGPALTHLDQSPASFGLVVALASNAATPVSATATDPAGNTSGCSNALTFVHDDQRPAPPVITGSTPTSPSHTSTNPTLSGSAESGTTVRLFTSPDCASAVAGTDLADPTGFAAAVQAAPNGSRTFYANATDAAGNASDCSAGFTYIHDDQKPAAPTWVGTTPPSPSRTSTSPTLSGHAETDAQVALYAGPGCTGSVLVSVTAAANDFSAAVTAAANQTSRYSATATDKAGNTSDCSLPIAYIHDSTPPDAPVLTGTTPPSPTNTNLNPVVNGSAEAGSTVRLYLNGSCSDPSVGAPATAAADQSFAIAATVTANSSTTFFAKAIDAAGNASACSNGVTYVHDNTGSGTPIIVRSIPASPNKTSTTPTLEGTAEAGSTVRLYKLPDCSGAVAGSGPATGGNFSIATSVTANTTTTFFAQATDTALNVSACSAGFAYTHDAQKPAKPTLTGTTPDSPAKSTTPTVNGSAEAGSTVRLYTNAGCTTANGAPATAAADLSFGISASVAATASTTFYATATDAAGNVSDCSDPLVYVSDNTAPAAPTWTGTTPTSPSSTSTTPTLAGSSEASATVRIYASTNCSGAAVATVGPLAAATFTQQVTAGANTTTSWTATATDAAGNVSPCSAAIAFTHDATAPPTPILTGTTPTSPSKASTTPSVNGTTAETGVSIDLFANGTCAGSATKTLANATASFSIATTVTANSATTFSAKARDAAGNASGCSNAISYTHDATAPAAPAITSSSPTSPSHTSTTPTLGGTAEALATVDIFTTSNCSGTVAGTGTATAGGFSGIAVNANANATTTFFARATDLAGNPSPCSAGFDYVHDNQGPTKPVLTGTNPASPSNSGAEPQVLGTITEAGLTLQLYKSTDCTGAIAATKTNAPTSFAITVSVGSNTTTPFSATATDPSGNTSACSNSISYTHDDKTPLKPVITGTNPTSPSNASTTPQVLGTTAEAGLTVRLHLAASCLDAVLASGPSTPSGGAGAFAISAPATANQTTVFYADATDAAGNLSTCSAGFAYVHDNTAPGVPVLTAFSPASPSTTNSGTTVTGSESDPTSKVFVYPSADCSGAAANPSGTTAVAGTFTIAFTAASLGCTPVSAKAVDAAGNASACSASLTFAHYGCGQCGCPASDWLREFGTTAADSASAIAMDYNSNLYVVGTTYGGLLGQLPLGSADGVLVKRASNGNFVWARQLGTAAYDSATAVTVDPLGNVYVAGSTEGDINGSGSAPPACATNLGAGTCGDAWIAKYDGTGSRLWVNRYSSARRESTTELEWDAKGTRVLMLVSSANDAGSGVSPQLFAVAPATGTMTQLWASIDDTQSKAPSGLAVDSSGNAYVQGRAPSPISGALSTTGSGGNGLVYIYKLTSAGGVAWLQHWGSPGLDAGTDLTVDGSGNVYAAGFLQGAPNGAGAVGGPYRGDSGAVPAVGGDAAVARFDSTGAQQWARIYGTPTDDLVASIWLYNARLYLAGQTKGDLGAGTATSLRGGVDIFVATLNLDGTAPASNTRQYGSAGDDLIGRSILDSGTWYIPGTSSADWVGMSKDMCNYLGLNDVFVGRFCSP